MAKIKRYRDAFGRFITKKAWIKLRAKSAKSKKPKSKAKPSKPSKKSRETPKRKGGRPKKPLPPRPSKERRRIIAEKFGLRIRKKRSAARSLLHRIKKAIDMYRGGNDTHDVVMMDDGYFDGRLDTEYEDKIEGLPTYDDFLEMLTSINQVILDHFYDNDVISIGWSVIDGETGKPLWRSRPVAQAAQAMHDVIEMVDDLAERYGVKDGSTEEVTVVPPSTIIQTQFFLGRKRDLYYTRTGRVYHVGGFAF